MGSFATFLLLFDAVLTSCCGSLRNPLQLPFSSCVSRDQLQCSVVQRW